MKYGKNQWSRISSLLTRKSAKQCKARWQEWLDPSIKKTEWSREEEERLLHLAKLMPCQWRTISQIVRRPPAMCMEHYERLLDQAQGKDNETVDPSEDPRRLRPGEIDPNPEAKPAKPDAVDMDEDEKEMLSEAVARLANTKGKKAKRKARERMLEEARRLATLQKRRELKAAGIDLPTQFRKPKGIDYNKEIPFERAAPAGFYDTSGETPITNDQEFLNQFLQKFDPKRKKAQDEKQKQKDENRKFQSLREENLPAAVLKFNKLNESKSEKKRGVLSLPAPQVSDEELELIVKTGYSSETAADAETGSAATRTLLPSFAGMTTPTPLRAPRTPQIGNLLQESAQDLIAMSTAQTPLLGGANPTLHSSSLGNSVTPRSKEMATPNVMIRATPQRVSGASAEEPARPSDWDAASVGSATPASVRDDRRSAKSLKRLEAHRLQSQLAALPAPRNEIRVVEPEAPQEEEKDEVSGAVIEDDAGEMEQHRRQVKKMTDAANQSTSVLRQLPRPSDPTPPAPPKEEGPEHDQAADLIAREVAALALRDAHEHPYPVSSARRKSKKIRVGDDLERFTADELSKAREMVVEATHEQPPSDASFGSLWSEMHRDLWLLPEHGCFERVTNMTKQEKLGALQLQFEALRNQMQKKVKKGLKLETEIRANCQPIMQRVGDLEAQCTHLEDEIRAARMEKASFALLASSEAAALPRRLEGLTQELGAVRTRERCAQDRYAQLKQEIEAMEAAGVVRLSWTGTRPSITAIPPQDALQSPPTPEIT
ncbi:putative Pre-mRNA-splicing factor cef-1 [Paratrimastix pyriformis]|uniref:Pre-mRNA-splicing factor cef-1 n=1 Tax=Paratrimastix pyriformis TaxID=342808 RepID=A0ABQ8UDV5_9EUKA|nr:putative Pre-mRNA-splicing factor cef-1 [Paratrimastix pyriformis]